MAWLKWKWITDRQRPHGHSLPRRAVTGSAWRRKIAAGLAALSTLVACGVSRDGSADTDQEPSPEVAAATGPAWSDKPVTLRVAMWDESQEATQRRFADAFEAAYPHVTVELDVLAFRQYVQTLQTAHAGGGGYDLIWMNAPNLLPFVSNDIILPLDDYVERDQFDTSVFPPGLVEMYTVDGQFYAVSKDFDTIGLYFDTDAFAEAGVAPPTNDWTWSDLAAAAESVTTDQRKGFAAPPYEQEVLFPFIYLSGGDPLTDGGSVSNFASPEACNALQFIQSFHTEGTSPDMATLDASWYVDALIEGDVAMLTSGSWDAQHLVEEMGDRVGVVELPAGSREANLVHGLGWAIMSSSPNPDLAWEFIKSVSTREAHEAQARDGVVISSYDGTAQIWVDSFDTLDVSMFVETAVTADPFPVASSDGGWTTAASDAFADALDGGTTGETMCASVDQATNAYISDHRTEP